MTDELTENLDIVYGVTPEKAAEDRHILAIIVDNEFGVLNRVVGLFSARGYNIEALTVAEVDDKKNYSRITIVTAGDQKTVHRNAAHAAAFVAQDEKTRLKFDVAVVEYVDLQGHGCPSLGYALKSVNPLCGVVEDRRLLRLGEVLSSAFVSTDKLGVGRPDLFDREV